MVLEHVRDDGHVRAVPERFQLKARKLEDDDVLRAEVVDFLDDRGPDVAADDDAPRPLRKDAVDERRGGGLPLRAGDADDRRGGEPEEEGHLGQHGNAAVESAKDGRRPWSYPGDHEHEVRFRQRRFVGRGAEDELDLFGDVAEARDPVDQLLAGLGVGDRDVCALADQEAREPRGRTALSQTDDRHAPAAELLGGHLGIERHGHFGRPMNPSWVP